MLEQMRKSSQSLLIYVLFGIIIAVFVINFGPQSQGSGCEGSMGGDESAAKVAGETISSQAFRSAFMLLGGGNRPPQVLKMSRFKETVMDKLIERELMAQEAERLGFAVSEDDVHKMLLEGRIIGLGVPLSVPRIQKDGVFNYDLFKNFTQFELGLTPDRFVQQQQREMLASQMRDLLRSSVKVSAEEVKTAFETKNRQVNLEYVRFPSRKYEGEIEPTADGLAARIAKGETFAKVARDASDDEDGRTRGGDLGWRRKGSLGLEAAGEEKLFAAKPGEVVGPLKASQGWVLLTQSAQRQGTLTFDAVKSELAEEPIKQTRAVAMAKQKANAALTAAKAAPDKTLKDLFSSPADARAEETGLFARRGNVIEQIGESPELAKAAFNLKPENRFAGPFEIAGSYVIVRLKERKDPDPAELEKQKVELQRDAELAKWNEVFTTWTKHRCLEAKGKGRITVNKTLLRYEDNQEPPPYDPCGAEAPRRAS